MSKKAISAYLKSIGRRGGKATVKKHGKKKMAAWGKLGGRPKATQS